MQHFRVVYHGISHKSISLFTHKALGGVHIKEIQVASEIFHLIPREIAA